MGDCNILIKHRLNDSSSHSSITVLSLSPAPNPSKLEKRYIAALCIFFTLKMRQKLLTLSKQDSRSRFFWADGFAGGFHEGDLLGVEGFDADGFDEGFGVGAIAGREVPVGV
jgi:hypothetical protein